MDRVDGRLVLTLEGVPVEADSVRLHLEIGDRAFDTTVPAAATIDVFSAVPVGEGTLDVTLLGGARVIARRVGMPVTIDAEAPATLVVDFDDGPALDVDIPAVHNVYTSDRIEVEVLDRSFAAGLTLEASVRGEPVALPPRSATGWLFDIDAFAAGDLLPVDLVLELEACADETPPRCAQHSYTVRVQREVWRGELGALSSVPPAIARDHVVTADDSGRVTVFAAATGEVEHTVTREGPLLAALGVDRDRVFVVDADEELVALSASTGTVSSWTVPLAGGRASDVVAYDGGFVVASGRALTFVAPHGSARTVFSAPQTIRARPFVDGPSIVLAGVDGRVVRIDAAGAVLDDDDLNASVRAGPVRTDGVTWVGTLDGRLIPIGGDAFDVGEPIAHPLLVLGEQVVAAAGSSLLFASPGTLRRVRLASPITGAPVAFRGGALVGLRSGLLVFVRPDGRQRTLSRLEGAALAASVTPDGDVVAVGSSAEVVRLRAEEDFLP